MSKNKIYGRAYNVTYDPGKHKRVIGWYVILTEDGEEYLVRHNTTQPWRCFRKVYQTDYSFRELVLTNTDLKQHGWRTTWWEVPVLYFFWRLVTRLIPQDLLFGKYNENFSIVEGISNLLVMAGVVGLLFYLLSLWRFARLKIFLRSQGTELTAVGKIRSNTPVIYLSNGKGIW